MIRQMSDAENDEAARRLIERAYREQGQALAVTVDVSSVSYPKNVATPAARAYVQLVCPGLWPGVGSASIDLRRRPGKRARKFHSARDTQTRSGEKSPRPPT